MLHKREVEEEDGEEGDGKAATNCTMETSEYQVFPHREKGNILIAMQLEAVPSSVP